MDWRASYFITFTCYGARLHGDDRGSWGRGRGGEPSRPVDPNAALVSRREHVMAGPPLLLSKPMRELATAAAVEVITTRDWKLFAFHARTNHVHVVLWADAAPEFVMRTLKAWITRRLREANLVGSEDRVWTRHGSTRYLWNRNEIESAVAYVVDNQGEDIGGLVLGTDRD